MKLIDTTDSLARICTDFAGSPFITVDTEFIRETTFWPRLCLVQMAMPGADALIDPLADKLDLSPFFDLMADKSILKVFHAARQDIEIVHHLADVIPAPLFDTQVAAMVCGFGDSIGYEHLIRKLTGAQVDKSSRFTDWARRPLTEKQLAYALSDVTHLREAYALLRDQLEQSGRANWLKEEMAVLESPKTYQAHPEDAWKRIKFRGKSKKAMSVFMAVAHWREELAQKEDVPRNRVMKDDAINEIALHPPTEAGDIARLRSVPRGFDRSARARTLLDAVRRGLDRNLDTVEMPPRSGQPSARPGNGVVEMLKVALKIASESNQVAQRLIATVPDLEKIAIDDNADVPALNGWRRELFGNMALAIKRGELGLVVVDGEVVVQPAAPAPATAMQAAK